MKKSRMDSQKHPRIRANRKLTAAVRSCTMRPKCYLPLNHAEKVIGDLTSESGACLLCVGLIGDLTRLRRRSATQISSPFIRLLLSSIASSPGLRAPELGDSDGAGWHPIRCWWLRWSRDCPATLCRVSRASSFRLSACPWRLSFIWADGVTGPFLVSNWASHLPDFSGVTAKQPAPSLSSLKQGIALDGGKFRSASFETP